MSTLTLGIDPGLTGAFALLDARGELIAVDDLPVVRDGKAGWIDAGALVSQLLQLRQGNDMHTTIERVHAMPKNGSQAAFSQGCTFGSILATLQVLHTRIEFVAPQSWKKAMGLISSKDMSDSQRKQMSLDKARLMFPRADLDRKKDHGRAEALLIAHWAFIRGQPTIKAA